MTWIKCSDRLPKRGEEVLALERDGSIYGVTYGVVGDNSWDCVCECREGSSLYGPNVTHWMPLPKPPEISNELD